jgi:hypothetical protein
MSWYGQFRSKQTFAVGAVSTGGRLAGVELRTPSVISGIKSASTCHDDYEGDIIEDYEGPKIRNRREVLPCYVFAVDVGQGSLSYSVVYLSVMSVGVRTLVCAYEMRSVMYAWLN